MSTLKKRPVLAVFLMCFVLFAVNVAADDARETIDLPATESCSGEVVDSTPQMTEMLAGGTWILDEKMVPVVKGDKRVTAGRYIVQTAEGKRIAATVTCTFSCSGSEFCSGSGCEESSGNCSRFNCMGLGCSGSCTKSSSSSEK